MLDPVSGEFNTEFEFSALPVSSGEVVEVVPVTRIDTKLLVVVPSTAWNRQIARRVLPARGLTKATSVEVQQCSQVDRTVATDGTMLVWMGFLQESLAEQLVSGDAVETVDYQFLRGDLPGYLPFARSLVDAAQDQYSFLSPTEGPAVDEKEESGEAASLGDRMTRMEEAIEKMSAVVTGMASDRGKRVTFDHNVGRPSALRTGKTTGVADKFPGLDPSVVASAVSAGVSEEALMEMQRLMGSQVGRAKRLMEPPLH